MVGYHALHIAPCTRFRDLSRAVDALPVRFRHRWSPHSVASHPVQHAPPCIGPGRRGVQGQKGAELLSGGEAPTPPDLTSRVHRPGLYWAGSRRVRCRGRGQSRVVVRSYRCGLGLEVGSRPHGCIALAPCSYMRGG
eukprot:scaffold2022_cov63-Phaeocystis_antarctica.AAC.2